MSERLNLPLIAYLAPRRRAVYFLELVGTISPESLPKGLNSHYLGMKASEKNARLVLPLAGSPMPFVIAVAPATSAQPERPGIWPQACPLRRRPVGMGCQQGYTTRLYKRLSRRQAGVGAGTQASFSTRLMFGMSGVFRKDKSGEFVASWLADSLPGTFPIRHHQTGGITFVTGGLYGQHSADLVWRVQVRTCSV